MTGNARPLKTVDLNGTICDVERIFRTVVGDSVPLTIWLGQSVGLIVGDSSRMNSVLVNLLMQARDVMPAGDELVVSTCSIKLDEAAARQMNLAPGRYAQLQVALGGELDTTAIREMVEEVHGSIATHHQPNGRFTLTVSLPAAPLP